MQAPTVKYRDSELPLRSVPTIRDAKPCATTFSIYLFLKFTINCHLDFIGIVHYNADILTLYFGSCKNGMQLREGIALKAGQVALDPDSSGMPRLRFLLHTFLT